MVDPHHARHRGQVARHRRIMVDEGLGLAADSPPPASSPARMWQPQHRSAASPKSASSSCQDVRQLRPPHRHSGGSVAAQSNGLQAVTAILALKLAGLGEQAAPSP